MKLNMNPESNYITQSLTDRLEDLQKNLSPGPRKFRNYFTQAYHKKNLQNSYSILSIGLAAQRQAQAEYEEGYNKLRRYIEDMADSRPYIRKAIMNRESDVKRGAEMALQKSFRNQEAFVNATAQRNLGGAVMSSLAKSHEQQKQRVASSTAMEMAKEKVARRQMYNQVISNQNRVMQAGLGQLQQMASAQGGIGLSGLQTGLGGMLGASAGIMGLGQAQGNWSLTQQGQQLDVGVNLAAQLTEWRGDDINMQSHLRAARREDEAMQEAERAKRIGAVLGMVGGGASWLSANTGIGKKFTDWAQSGTKKVLGKIFGEVEDEAGTS